MPRDHTVKVFEFDELNDEAKEKARDWFREGDEFDADYILEDAATIAEMLGIELNTTPVQLMSGKRISQPAIHYEGFGCQGNGASFEGRYSFGGGRHGDSLKAIAGHAPQDKDLIRIAQELEGVQQVHDFKLHATVKSSDSRSSHEHSVSIEVMKPNADGDEEEVDVATAETVSELLRDFMRWIYKQLEAEFEYRQSDEAVDEGIRANEYEFYEDGKRVCR